MIKSLIDRHKKLWKDKFFSEAVLFGFLLLIVSLLINYVAVRFAFREIGNATTDILLDNLPLINTDIIFSEGALVFVFFVIFLLFLKPKTIPFTVKSVALFVFIRSAFVIMTHLAPFPDHIVPDLDSLRYISLGADLFFSVHTGMPFLMALLFWDDKYLRRFFLFCSVIAAVTVIFGHLHYTIDVFSAFFITYGVYHIARKFFVKDYKFFTSGFAAKDLI